MRQTISLLSLLILAPLLVADPPIQADFVAATTGSDANPGTLAEPFATLSRARNAVRKLNDGGSPKTTVTVLVRDGTYVLEEMLVFGPKDSGTPQRCIDYAAYLGEMPILSGGRVHGRSISPDGKHCAFEDPAYRLYLADADGSNAKQSPPTLRDAPERQEGVAHHGSEEGARRHVGFLAALCRAVMYGRVAAAAEVSVTGCRR